MNTFKVTFESEHCSLSGDVTAGSLEQAMAAASVAWGVADLPGTWHAVLKPVHVLVSGVW